MTRTVRIITASGLNIYAKPSPIAAGTWGDDVISFTPNENDGREYSATIGDGGHVAFVRAGGSPLATDRARWTFDEVDARIGEIIDTLGAPAGASIAADIAAIEIPTLTGPWTRTITVTDSVSGSPIQNATVRFFRTGETESQATNASGVATFTVEAATWSYAIVANGYAGASGTVEVSGSGDTAIALVLSSVTPPSSPTRSVLQVLCLDEDGEPEPGVAVDIRIIKVPSGDNNIAYKGSKQTATSNSSGIARFEAIKSAQYQIKRGTADEWETITIGTGDTTNVMSFIGSP